MHHATPGRSGVDACATRVENAPVVNSRASFFRDLARLGPYPRRLLALLTIATTFEGFDTALAQLVLPVIGREFGASGAECARALGTSSLGMIAAAFAIRLADRFGRRPVLLGSLAGYALFSLATAGAPSLAAFTALQLVARFFMATQLALAYVMLSEELPAALRGRANGVLGAFAGIGAGLPFFWLAPLEQLGPGWRGLFAIGALPLLLLPVYARTLRETAAFAALRPRAWREELRELGALLAPRLRARFAGATALFFAINVWSGAALGFFTTVAFQERGWNATDLQRLAWGALPAAAFGYGLAGFAMDWLGRRPALLVYLAACTLAGVICHQAEARAGIAAAYLTLIALGGVWTLASTLTAELFPTALRAGALGFANNLLGRSGLVLAPFAVGALAPRLGATSDAVTWLALAPLAVAPFLWRAVPETRGADLSGRETEPLKHPTFPR